MFVKVQVISLGQQQRLTAPLPPKNRVCESPRIRLKPFFGTRVRHGQIDGTLRGSTTGTILTNT